MTYTPTIGLEVHAELATKSKMFCGCTNAPHGSEPNTHTCPVCLAHPGTLPVPNKEAITMVLQFGAAVDAEQATYSEFDRKNYFYPDIPKAYQISQYQFPFLKGGSLNGVELTRVHLEEDTARSSHELVDGSLVDFNRAGVPLMELVTEPVMHDAETASAFARELQLLLQTLGISHANMERGEMRIEANVSISPDPEKMSSTYVELKNINSFKAVESAIAYEIARQTELLENGDKITQETRGWDENKAVTFSQRSKETAKDYRYFPDPDIPKLDLRAVPEFDRENLAENLSMLPEKKREIYHKYKVNSDTVEILISNIKLDRLVSFAIEREAEEAVVRLAANYCAVDLLGLEKASLVRVEEIKPELFLELMQLTAAGTIGSKNTKELLLKLVEINDSVGIYAQEAGLVQQSDAGALAELAQTIIAENEAQVTEYRAGKEAVLKYLVGQGMKLSQGSANPAVLEEVLLAEIAK